MRRDQLEHAIQGSIASRALLACALYLQVKQVL
jgi:hypothetical protein